MKALVQRVSEARVEAGGRTLASIGSGLLVLLGVEKGDAEADLDFTVRKVANLRVFEDEGGKMNLSVRDTGGEALVVSQFTLAGDVRKGNRPSFDGAEEPGKAEAMYLEFVRRLEAEGVRTSTGEFAARMAVGLVNDGPVTIIIESKKP
ncbi:MAG: D-aminoacyl-tRNA deacylase [Nitrospirota bacterium]|jgi:D-tyrosyl-tRNA(Tyr) deacylase